VVSPVLTRDSAGTHRGCSHLALGPLASLARQTGRSGQPVKPTRAVFQSPTGCFPCSEMAAGRDAYEALFVTSTTDQLRASAFKT
jgi:hypothetical protein